jgi:hypothetical protein
MNETVYEFAKRYTAAWCSQNAASVAACYSSNGSLKINDGLPAVGRNSIAASAQSFMTAFPDLCVMMDMLSEEQGCVIYRWTLVGTNSGPGGTGKKVKISGFEEWNIGSDGLIAVSLGHFDEAEFRRQLEVPPTETR